MYLESQDEHASPVFRLYVPLLVFNSGSGGRAHLKIQQRNSDSTISKRAAADKGRGFLIALKGRFGEHR
jgi:hypothetical protein